MHGADQRILDHNGTGAEAVHHISPEMIADEPRLQDRETRKRVHKALVDGDVIVAHNVNFEQKHLFHHMPALKQSTKWLDTAWLARHFMPAEVDGVKRNGKLETFSEDNGVPYVNAHRAAEDADMMIDAMTAFFGKKGWSDSPFTGE
jgi:DNA polymerase III epsilon subunit-like protein